MKKLLVLSLVLGMASLATAGLSLSAEGDVVSVVSDNGESYVAYLVYSSNLTGVVALTPEATPAGSLSELTDYDVNPGADLGWPSLGEIQVYNFLVGSSVVGALQPGVHVTGTFAGLQFGDVDMGLGRVDLLSEDLSANLGSVFVVPEPATLALLGLGVLALRRKK